MKKILLLVLLAMLISCAATPRSVDESWKYNLIHRSGAQEIEGEIHTSTRKDKNGFLFVTVNNETGIDLVYRAMEGNLPLLYEMKDVSGKSVISSSIGCTTGFADWVLKTGESRELIIGKSKPRSEQQYILFQDVNNKLHYKIVAAE